MTPSVVLRQVVKRYGPVTAVHELTFEIADGTLVTLLGPSGCGKTSTLRLIAGLEQPTAGQILIGGKDVTSLSAAERDVSMVFQSYALFPHMTVLENVCYGLRASGFSARRARETAEEKLGAVGLVGYGSRLPSELSGGQQQRVAVARAVVLEPKVLLFDEPLSNLDAKLRRQVREDIRALQQELKLTVVYVTHDQEEALAVSDRIVVMRDGRIVQDGSPRDLYERPTDAFIADFIGHANLLPIDVGPGGEVRLGPLRLAVTHEASPGPARLAVRPHGFALRRGSAGADEIEGEVRRAAYLGSHMEYDVALPQTQSEVLVIDPNVVSPLAHGEQVALCIRPGAAAVVPA